MWSSIVKKDTVKDELQGCRAPPSSPSMIPLDFSKNIEEVFLKNVEVIDTQKHFYNYHHNRYATNGEKNVRGWIYDTLKKKIVKRSMPHIPEFSIYDIQRIKEYISSHNISFYPLFETLVVYLWYNEYDEVWSISTNKKIDAHSSYWGIERKSIGYLFIDTLEKYHKKSWNVLTGQLDKDYTYVFILTPDENFKLVSRYTYTPEIFSLYKIHNYTGKFTSSNFNDLAFLELKKINLNSIENAIEYSSTCFNGNGSTIGLYCVLDDGRSFNITNQRYLELLTIRGKSSCPVQRYFEVRYNLYYQQMLQKMYPYIHFNEYENIVLHIANRIYDAFVKRYIKGEHVIIPKLEYQFLKSRLLILYRESPIDYNIIYQLLKELNPIDLYNMVISYQI